MAKKIKPKSEGERIEILEAEVKALKTAVISVYKGDYAAFRKALNLKN